MTAITATTKTRQRRTREVAAAIAPPAPSASPKLPVAAQQERKSLARLAMLAQRPVFAQAQMKPESAEEVLGRSRAAVTNPPVVLDAEMHVASDAKHAQNIEYAYAQVLNRFPPPGPGSWECPHCHCEFEWPPFYHEPCWTPSSLQSEAAEGGEIPAPDPPVSADPRPHAQDRVGTLAEHTLFAGEDAPPAELPVAAWAALPITDPASAAIFPVAEAADDEPPPFGELDDEQKRRFQVALESPEDEDPTETKPDTPAVPGDNQDDPALDEVAASES